MNGMKSTKEETWSLTFQLRFNLRQGSGNETSKLLKKREECSFTRMANNILYSDC